jgi:uncharacterized protein (DUF952 family)
MIYHITTKTEWEQQSAAAHYKSQSLNQEGFIHCCSTDLQVKGVLQKYFVEQTDLLLLYIEPTKLTAELKYELATNQEVFPHIYGEMNKEAIVKIADIQTEEIFYTQ